VIYIENDGALFRGPARAWPKEVWNGSEFVPYKGSVPKDIEWGDEIDEAAAKRLMGGAEQAAAEPAQADADKGAA
jgi:hypothetical protein